MDELLTLDDEYHEVIAILLEVSDLEIPLADAIEHLHHLKARDQGRPTF